MVIFNSYVSHYQRVNFRKHLGLAMTLPRRRFGAATQLWRRLLLLHQVKGSAHAEEHGDGGDGQDATDAAGKHGWITRHLGNSRCVFRAYKVVPPSYKLVYKPH